MVNLLLSEAAASDHAPRKVIVRDPGRSLMSQTPHRVPVVEILGAASVALLHHPCGAAGLELGDSSEATPLLFQRPLL